MISLSKMPATSEGLLTRAAPRVDGGGEIIWDIDVAFGCDSDEAAETVSMFVPGALKAWGAGSHGSKSSVKSVGGYDLVKVDFCERDNGSIASGHADIRHCTFSVAGDHAMLVVRLRVHGLLQEAAAELVYKLDGLIEVTVGSQQLKLFTEDDVFIDPEPVPEDGVSKAVSNVKKGQAFVEEFTAAIDEIVEKQTSGETPQLSVIDDIDGEPALDVGELIVFEFGSEVISGVLREKTNDTIELETMDGSRMNLPAHKVNVINSFSICTDEPGRKISDYVKDYVDITSGAGSWDDYVQAFGELFAENSIAVTPGGSWPLSDIVTARAIDIFASYGASGDVN